MRKQPTETVGNPGWSIIQKVLETNGVFLPTHFVRKTVRNGTECGVFSKWSTQHRTEFRSELSFCFGKYNNIGIS